MTLTTKLAEARLSNTYRGGDRVYLKLTGSTSAQQQYDTLSLRQQVALFREHCESEVKQLVGVPSDTRMSFSKHAGCRMCPCSPGFILEGVDFRRDIWVTVDIRV